MAPVAKGNIPQPEQLKHALVIYFEHWLSAGEAYEFTMPSTEQPLAELVHEFRRIIKDANLQDVLGLYHIDGEKNAPPSSSGPRAERISPEK